MEALQQIRISLDAQLKELERLESQYDGLASAIQEKRREISEYDTALRILSKVCGVPEPEDTPLVGRMTAKDAMLEVIRRNPDAGLQSRELRSEAKNSLGVSIPPNSASNYLWVLRREGKIRRIGHRWFLADKTEAPAATGASEEGG
ncbi:MAG: hypothetical protein IH878_14360 [Gemmatimonadetes bacterium]|nr:hypothetical protein [Gemmatimonadota bacterium]